MLRYEPLRFTNGRARTSPLNQFLDPVDWLVIGASDTMAGTAYNLGPMHGGLAAPRNNPKQASALPSHLTIAIIGIARRKSKLPGKGRVVVFAVDQHRVPCQRQHRLVGHDGGVMRFVEPSGLVSQPI